MKIKVFKFEVCNAYVRADNPNADWALECKEKMKDEKFIEETINEFINGKSVVSITISPIEVHQHNNCGSNTWWLFYTIAYND